MDLLGKLSEAAKKGYVSAYEFAAIHMGLGDQARALEWLQRAYDEHSGFMVYVHLDPRFKPLRTEARFRDLSDRVGFRNQNA